MKLTRPLMMTSEFLRTIMQNEFGLVGGAVREDEMNNAVTFQFGFYGPDNFENRGRFDYFTKAVEDTVTAMNRYEAGDENFDGGPPAVQYDSQSQTLLAENPAHYADFLEQFSRRQGLSLDVPVTQLTGYNADFKLTDHFRAKAEAALQNPAVLEDLETNHSYNGKDDLYRAVLAAEDYRQHKNARPQFSLDNIRAAFRTEEQRGKTAGRSPVEPTFWLH
jgi:hypothetical protein